MRLGARLDQIIESIAKGERPLLKAAITQVYEEAYREGYTDGQQDCKDEQGDDEE
jgi:flagellar biosynthesis/type III secretory pathway protein FliH